MRQTSMRSLVLGLILVAGCSSSRTATVATPSGERSSSTSALNAAMPTSTAPSTSTAVPEATTAPAPQRRVPTFDEIVATAGQPAGPVGLYNYASVLNGVYRTPAATYVWFLEYWGPNPDPLVTISTRSLAHVFRSVDGVTWVDTGISAPLGDVDSVVASVVEVKGTLLASVTTTDPTHAQQLTAVMLASRDGSAWQPVATITGASSVRAGMMYVLGRSVVQLGADDVCSFDGADIRPTARAPLQARMWTSSDMGKTWNDVPQSEAALDVKTPPPKTRFDCPSGAHQLDDRVAEFGTMPLAVEQIGDRLVVSSADHVRIASTSDGLIWTTSKA